MEYRKLTKVLQAQWPARINWVRIGLIQSRSEFMPYQIANDGSGEAGNDAKQRQLAPRMHEDVKCGHVDYCLSIVGRNLCI